MTIVISAEDFHLAQDELTAVMVHDIFPSFGQWVMPIPTSLPMRSSLKQMSIPIPAMVGSERFKGISPAKTVWSTPSFIP